MINVKDLRIGNYILLDTGFFLPQWHAIMPKDIYDISEGRITLKSLEPIPLTPEVLKKCGVEKVNTHLYKLDDLFYLMEFADGYSIRLGADRSGSMQGKSLKELHQLQNLYFALTGEELQINIPQHAMQ